MSLKLLESLDNNIFNAEMKESLEKEFNEAVNAEAKILAESMIEQEKTELQEKFQKKIDEIEDKGEDYIDFLDGKAEKFSELLEKNTEECNNFYKKELSEKLDDYLNYVIEENLGEIKSSLKASANTAKLDALMEMFKKMCEITCINADEIVSEKSSESSNDFKEQLDEVLDENIKLKNENNALLKQGLINEMAEGLTLRQQERFKTFAEKYVNFKNSEDFVNDLNKLKDEIKSDIVAEKSTEQKSNPVHETLTYNWNKYI